MGLLLRRWRERKGLSMRALGEQSGVSYVTIAKIEAGTVSPTLLTLEKLAGALGLSVRDLFSADPAPVPRKWRGRRG
jgi:transcriptional regulator with XRE-family HTH domain